MNELNLNALLSCKLFEGFSLESLQDIIKNLKHSVVNYSAGDIYALEGTACRSADIILRGKLKAWMVGLSSKEAVIDVRTIGHLMAPAFIFSHNNKIPVSVEVEEDSSIFRLTTEEFEKLLSGNALIRRNFIAYLSDMAVFLTEKVRVLSLSSVRDKVFYMLHSEYKKQGSAEIELNRSRTAIAQSFGIQKFSLIRCLNELQKEGRLIQVDGKRIRLLKLGYFK